MLSRDTEFVAVPQLDPNFTAARYSLHAALGRPPTDAEVIEFLPEFVRLCAIRIEESNAMVYQDASDRWAAPPEGGSPVVDPKLFEVCRAIEASAKEGIHFRNPRIDNLASGQRAVVADLYVPKGVSLPTPQYRSVELYSVPLDQLVSAPFPTTEHTRDMSILDREIERLILERTITGTPDSVDEPVIVEPLLENPRKFGAFVGNRSYTYDPDQAVPMANRVPMVPDPVISKCTAQEIEHYVFGTPLADESVIVEPPKDTI